MKLTLHIYDDKGNVTKTYEREDYSIKMKQLKKIIQTIELDKLGKLLNGKTKEKNVELVNLASDFVLNSWETVQVLVCDIFEGMTEEEYENTYLQEVANVLIALGKYTVNTIGIAGRGSKN